MRKQNWFDSPLATPFNFGGHLLNKDLDLEQQAMRIVQTPHPLIHHRHSPFTQYNHDLRGSLPQEINQDQSYENKGGIIDKVIFSSGSEDEEAQEENFNAEAETPKQEVKLKEEINSTGTKSHRGKVVEGKKSRPKEKGLRGLSAKAYAVVLEQKSTTYKEVALKLLKQLSLENELDNSTEETNVKRRVYDALNVLIAVGILHKDGRKIVTKTGTPGLLTSHHQLELLSLKKKLRAKEEAISEKRKKLQQARMKFQSIKSLINRNLSNKLRGSKLNFPFIGVANFNQWQMIQSAEQSLQMRFDSMVTMFGDMDSLRHLFS